MVKISRPCPRFSSVRFRIVPDTPIMNGWNRRRGRVRVKTRPRRPRSRARGGRGARPPPGAESRLPSPPITAFPFESRAAAAGPPRGDPRPAAGAGCCRVRVRVGRSVERSISLYVLPHNAWRQVACSSFTPRHTIMTPTRAFVPRIRSKQLFRAAHSRSHDGS